MTQEQILSEKEISEIKDSFKHFPLKSAACIEGLKIVQKYHRWVSDEALKELAAILEMSVDAVDSVATYYNLIYRKPVGRHVIHVCNSVSCYIMGYDEIIAFLRHKLGIEYGETTADDRFTLLSVSCLGDCDHAPVLMIDDDLHQNLTTDKLEKILNNYE
ncbi:MAG: NADH-quinone oxidoreductase subunit NuoE [Eubacteriaceae bacterium]|nr:NADH-quinone oxidoreductase subunit NuoE [Eubacteriaceae bacterium]